MPGDWLTVTEAATRSGYNAEYLRQLMRSADPPFEFMRVGRQYFINTASFTAFCKERQASGGDVRFGPRRPGVDTESDIE